MHIIIVLCYSFKENIKITKKISIEGSVSNSAILMFCSINNFLFKDNIEIFSLMYVKTELYHLSLSINFPNGCFSITIKST